MNNMIMSYILIFIKFFENNIILCNFFPFNIENWHLFKNINFLGIKSLLYFTYSYFSHSKYLYILWNFFYKNI